MQVIHGKAFSTIFHAAFMTAHVSVTTCTMLSGPCLTISAQMSCATFAAFSESSLFNLYVPSKKNPCELPTRKLMR